MYCYRSSLKEPKKPSPPKKKSVVVHYQEIQNKTFRTEIRSSSGKKRPTTVFGHIDLDEGKHNKGNADLNIRVPFFSQKPGLFVRALHSDIKKARADKCHDTPVRLGGSEEIVLQKNTKYCIRTNKGRMASIVIYQILTSWGKYAEIDVKMAIQSFNAVLPSE